MCTACVERALVDRGCVLDGSYPTREIAAWLYIHAEVTPPVKAALELLLEVCASVGRSAVHYSPVDGAAVSDEELQEYLQRIGVQEPLYFRPVTQAFLQIPYLSRLLICMVAYGDATLPPVRREWDFPLGNCEDGAPGRGEEPCV